MGDISKWFIRKECGANNVYYGRLYCRTDELKGVRLKQCNRSTIPKQGAQNQAPQKKGLFKRCKRQYNLSGAGRHEIALSL